MKATRNINDREVRSQTSLLRKIADFVTHPAMAGYTFTGTGSLATGQAGAFCHALRETRYRGSSVMAANSACPDGHDYCEAVPADACRDLAFSTEF